MDLSRSRTCTNPLNGFADQSLTLCEDKCSANEDCAFFTLNDSGYCTLYNACDPSDLRIPATNGDTYVVCPIPEEWLPGITINLSFVINKACKNELQKFVQYVISIFIDYNLVKPYPKGACSHHSTA